MFTNYYEFLKVTQAASHEAGRAAFSFVNRNMSILFNFHSIRPSETIRLSVLFAPKRLLKGLSIRVFINEEIDNEEEDLKNEKGVAERLPTELICLNVFAFHSVKWCGN